MVWPSLRGEGAAWRRRRLPAGFAIATKRVDGHEEAADNWVRKPIIGTKRESFIAGAKWQQEQDKKCYHPMTERKHTSDVHFECTICGYNNY